MLGPVRVSPAPTDLFTLNGIEGTYDEVCDPESEPAAIPDNRVLVFKGTVPPINELGRNDSHSSREVRVEPEIGLPVNEDDRDDGLATP